MPNYKIALSEGTARILLTLPGERACDVEAFVNKRFPLARIEDLCRDEEPMRDQRKRRSKDS